MFFNMLTRRRAFRPGPEEHNLCVDVIARYAVHAAGRVGFTVKRLGEARSELHTTASGSRVDAVRALYSPDLAAGLLPLEAAGGGGAVGPDVLLDAPLSFKLSGLASALTYSGRRSALLLFINGRPVEQPQLKRALEGVYTALNPKAAKPWMYLDLQLPPRHVEINVHPTKREVGFLHQQALIDALCGALEAVLTRSLSTRSFAVNMPVLPASIISAGGSGGRRGRLAEQQQQQQPSAQHDSGSREMDGSQQDVTADEEPPGSNPTGGGSGGSGSGGTQAAAGRQQQQQQRQQQMASQAPPPQRSASARPERLVRTDHRTQTLDGFLIHQASAAALAACTTTPAAARRRASTATAAAAVGSGGLATIYGDGNDDDNGGGGGGGAGQGAVLLSNASLHLCAAEAEKASAAAELEAVRASQRRGGAGTAAAAAAALMLRAAVRPRLPLPVTHLTSVQELLSELQADTHPQLEDLFRGATWVGMVCATAS